MDFDCTTCGACCAFDRDWPRLQPVDGDGPGPAWVVDGGMRWVDGQCAALNGTVGERVGCAVYARRPQVCRDCGAGSVSCLVARRRHGLPVPAEQSPLDALLG